jgi:ppGpp synthetase/RelA/SpoT-type nucleotidyltranferase
LYKPTEPRKDISFNDEIDIECGELSMTLSSGKSITLQIEHRLKSMRSILLKLWESEDYNNIDAMRDMIGVAIVFPVITAEEKIEVITKMTTLFADKGYMAKNKNLFQ